MTAASVTLRARELRDLLTPVLPLAGKDGMLPALTTVNLTVNDGYLTAEATDRFRAGVCRHVLGEPSEHDDDRENFKAAVYVSDLRRVLSLFKPTRTADPELRLTVRGLLLEVTNTGAFDGLVDATLVFAVHDGEFPNVRKLFVEAMQLDPSPEPRAFNPAFLAGFAAAARNGYPLVLRQGDPNKPLIVTCGDHFVGALMPVRTHDGDGHAGESQKALVSWRELLMPKAVSA